jgi:periplasmic divalent cation tolerance protein
VRRPYGIAEEIEFDPFSVCFRPAMTTGTRLVLCTAPDAATAERIATAMVEERLAACVNVMPGVASAYRWEGKVERATEVLLLMKSSADRYPALEARVRELHPYAVPEVIALAIAEGSAPYLEWITESTRP